MKPTRTAAPRGRSTPRRRERIAPDRRVADGPSARPSALRSLAAAVACVAALAACSPEHDWREIRAEDAHALVALPAKPARMTRPIHLETLKVDMTMVGAQAAAVAYTVGAVPLPDASDATRERALAAMRAAMVRNIGGTERAARPVEVKLVDPGGGVAGTVRGVEIEATGRMGERDATLIARFVGSGGWAWQAVVLGPRPDRELAAQFLDSLRVWP
ncbi:MAG TPA: hypothetical protein VEA81_07955 [Burkholderiaceae bacterium]|nr:hypothetical protein [Burkholderiaceae bacterium]